MPNNNGYAPTFEMKVQPTVSPETIQTQIGTLTLPNADIARKKWVFDKVTKFRSSNEYKFIMEAVKYYENKKIYATKDEEEFESITPDLRRSIQRKVRFIFGRPFSVEKAGDYNKELLTETFLNRLSDTAKEAYRSGIGFWELEPDIKSPLKLKPVLRKAWEIIPLWENIDHEKLLGYIHMFNETNIDDNGNEVTKQYADYVTIDARLRYNLSDINAPTQVLGHYTETELDATGRPAKTKQMVFPFIPLVPFKGSDDETSLFRLSKSLIDMYNRGMDSVARVVDKNTKPVREVRNFSGSAEDRADVEYNLDTVGVVFTEGTGGFAIHPQAMDTAANESYLTRTRKEYHKATATVDMDRELEYAASGKALDRMYVDMEIDALDLAAEFKKSLIHFIELCDIQNGGKQIAQDIKFIFNMDKPTDETAVIDNINKSRGLLSDETLIAQHPYVDDVTEELKKIEAEKEKAAEQMSQLYDGQSYNITGGGFNTEGGEDDT